MATLRHALFADFITQGHKGKPTIVGLFANVYLPEEKLTNTLFGPFYLFIQIDCSVVEGSHHQVDLRFIDTDGQQVGQAFSYPEIGMTQPGPGLPLTAMIITQIMMPFPKHGEYVAEIRVDGNRLEGCPMIAVTEPPPQRRD